MRSASLGVAIVLFDGTKLIDVCGPLQVCADARGQIGQSAYRTQLLSLTGGPVQTDTGAVLPTRSIEGVIEDDWDTVLLSGGSSAYAAACCTKLLAAIDLLAPRCRRLGSVCLGAFILAAGGHLDGRRATTHWEGCETLSNQYPTIDVVDDAIFVTDGPIWTSAGVTSGIDMALAMVEEDLGRAESLRLARSFV